MLAFTYLAYILIYEGLVLGGCAYLVFAKQASPWWFVLAVLLSAGAYKPKQWRYLMSRTKKQEAK